jgi:hypothetical protein
VLISYTIGEKAAVVSGQDDRPHLHTHFAGEHLADWQGFMEGAINTGEEAAGRI